MRLIELICCCAIISSFFPFLSGALIPAVKIHSRTVQIEHELNRDKFLYNGFINLCKSTKESEWLFESSQWKDTCSSMWDFEELKIKREGKLYKESWKYHGKTMEALFYKKQESL